MTILKHECMVFLLKRSQATVTRLAAPSFKPQAKRRDEVEYRTGRTDNSEAPGKQAHRHFLSINGSIMSGECLAEARNEARHNLFRQFTEFEFRRANSPRLPALRPLSPLIDLPPHSSVGLTDLLRCRPLFFCLPRSLQTCRYYRLWQLSWCC